MNFTEKYTVYDEACATLKKWENIYGAHEDFFLHVNLSPKQITRSTLTQEIVDAITKNGISPRNLILETT